MLFWEKCYRHVHSYWVFLHYSKLKIKMTDQNPKYSKACAMATLVKSHLSTFLQNQQMPIISMILLCNLAKVQVKPCCACGPKQSNSFVSCSTWNKVLTHKQRYLHHTTSLLSPQVCKHNGISQRRWFLGITETLHFGVSNTLISGFINDVEQCQCHLLIHLTKMHWHDKNWGFQVLQHTGLLTYVSLSAYIVQFISWIWAHSRYVWYGLNVLCLWVPVTMSWRVLRLRMEERPPIWRVAANKLNNQSRTDDKGWSSSLGVRCAQGFGGETWGKETIRETKT